MVSLVCFTREAWNRRTWCDSTVRLSESWMLRKNKPHQFQFSVDTKIFFQFSVESSGLVSERKVSTIKLTHVSPFADKKWIITNARGSWWIELGIDTWYCLSWGAFHTRRPLLYSIWFPECHQTKQQSSTTCLHQEKEFRGQRLKTVPRGIRGPFPALLRPPWPEVWANRRPRRVSYFQGCGKKVRYLQNPAEL